MEIIARSISENSSNGSMLKKTISTITAVVEKEYWWEAHPLANLGRQDARVFTIIFHAINADRQQRKAKRWI
jgi:hypothetical protein